MIKHEFVPISYPLYSNYRDKTGNGEDFSLRIIGFDVVHENEGMYLVPLDIGLDGQVDEVHIMTRDHDVCVTETPLFKDGTL